MTLNVSERAALVFASGVEFEIEEISRVEMDDRLFTVSMSLMKR